MNKSPQSVNTSTDIGIGNLELDNIGLSFFLFKKDTFSDVSYHTSY